MQQLTPEQCAEIDKFLAKYPADQRQSAVISTLLLLQRANNGWLSDADIEMAADYIGMPKIAVYEVATFYSMFELKPVGKHKICVCTNISCMLNGCDTIVDHLKDKLQIGFNETTRDGKFSLKAVECLAACSGAPMMQIGPKYYEKLTPEKLDQILAELD